MSSSFHLSVQQLDGCTVINFANQSPQFVEVIFTIDGKEVKEGRTPDKTTRGYGYPPKLEKTVKKMKNGQALFFNQSGGTVQAFIFAGEGGYHDDDLNKPTFLRHTMVDKFRFKRASAEPVEILTLRY